MSAYITTADVQGHLRDAFAQLYTLPADADEVAGDIARAEALVNGYVGKRYVVPVTAPAEAVLICKALALDLFVEHAYETRAAGSELPKTISDGGAAALAMLKDIAAGKMSLAGATAAESQDAGAAALVKSANDPLCTREQLSGF